MTKRAKHSPASDTWQTPDWVLDISRDVLGDIYLDPATSYRNPTHAARFCTPEQDGLQQSWDSRGVFVNPPFSRKNDWISKAKEESLLLPNLDILMIVPGSVIHNVGSAPYLPQYFAPLGRVKFKPTLELLEERGSKTSGGMQDMVLLYWGARQNCFKEILKGQGIPVYKAL